MRKAGQDLGTSLEYGTAGCVCIYHHPLRPWVQFPVTDLSRTTKRVFVLNSMYLPECDVPRGPPVCGGGMDCVYVETEEVILWSVVPK